jgi:transposase-like protein
MIIGTMRQCPFCATEDRQVKAGLNASGSQRLKCNQCGRKFTPLPHSKRYPDSLRAEAVRMYLSGLSFRTVSIRLSVNHQSVINWVNEYAVQLPRPVGRSLSRR